MISTRRRPGSGKGGIGAFLFHLHPPLIPGERARIAFSFCLGGLSFFLFCVLCVTGVLLMFYYRSGQGSAYLSVREITEAVPYGDLFRGLHYWAGQGIVWLILLHMCRVVMTGSYQGPKRWIWGVGMVLLALILVMDFSGYLLRFDQDTYWAGTVALGLVKRIPLVGQGLHQVMTGTPAYGEDALQRIYLWHCVVLPLGVLAFAANHFWKIRRLGWQSGTR